MGDTFAISALRRKRAHLAGAIEQTERQIAAQRETLATLDAVLRMFEPPRSPELIPSIRPCSRKCLFFPRGELTRLCLSGLREVGKPMTVRALAEWVPAVKGRIGARGSAA
jgi:hypothetical protein